MHADVERDAARFFCDAFPAHTVPATAGRDVRQLDIGPPRSELLLQLLQLRQQPELQHGVHAPSRFLLEGCELIQVPRAEYARLLAARVRADPQREADM